MLFSDVSSIFSEFLNFDKDKLTRSVGVGVTHSFIFQYLCPQIDGNGMIPSIPLLVMSVGIVYVGCSLYDGLGMEVGGKTATQYPRILKTLAIGLTCILVEWAPFLPNLPSCTDNLYQFQFLLPLVYLASTYLY